MHQTRLRIGVSAAVVVVLLALAIAVLFGALSSAPATQRIPVSAPSTAPAAAPAGASPPPSRTDGVNPSASPAYPRGDVLVHVGGAVRLAGVYRLRAGARVLDAVASASGFADDADRDAINLARPVADGEQLYVPRLGEQASAHAPSGATPKINLNRATQAELEGLPRVGPALAQRIVQFREQHGSFASVDALRSVSGIGDAVFSGLRDLITV